MATTSSTDMPMLSRNDVIANLIEWAKFTPALTFAIASIVPFSLETSLWILGACSWMPALGWLACYFFFKYIALARLSIAAISIFWISKMIIEKRVEKKDEKKCA